MADKSFFIDTTKCTACRGCQIACKQWNKNPGTKTYQRGNHQNPEDLSFFTFKLVRFSEHEVDGNPQWLFFPDQCRHCLTPPCKEVADSKAKGAILQDEATGAVIFNPKVKMKRADFQETREACPYDIPRWSEKTGGMAKCTMCIDRVKEGLLPACVKTCPTGAMSFGDREEMLEKANKRLAEVQTKFKDAMLANPDDVRVIFLLADDPQKYYKTAVAANTFGITRKMALKRILRPLRNLTIG
ncbi:MAG: formate dehydrogenase [Deltaproteobacteria bacterium RBG_13_52_11b]|nr:MAG: formate dehydrogenase [Deltaproteobacteria bacterium RBG_13_52_11b]